MKYPPFFLQVEGSYRRVEMNKENGDGREKRWGLGRGTWGVCDTHCQPHVAGKRDTDDTSCVTYPSAGVHKSHNHSVSRRKIP